MSEQETTEDFARQQPFGSGLGSSHCHISYYI